MTNQNDLNTVTILGYVTFRLVHKKWWLLGELCVDTVQSKVIDAVEYQQCPSHLKTTSELSG